MMRIAALVTAWLLVAAASAFAADPGNGAAGADAPAVVTAPAGASAPPAPESGVAVTVPDKLQRGARLADASATPTRAAAPGAKLYAPSSQLINWPMQVMVSPDLPEGAAPKLTLLISHGHTTAEVRGCADIPLQFMSRNQTWIGGADTDGANTQHVGTLLLYDLSSAANCKLDRAKPMTRVRPILDWTADGKACADCRLIGTDFVNLGNATAAFFEALVAVAFGVILILVISRTGGSRKFVELFYSVDDGKLSLSMLQMTLWTLAAALMVVFEDMLRLDTPTVPASIVVLMGMSVLTTGFSYHLTANPPSGKAAVRPDGPSALFSSRLFELISIPDADGNLKLSLSRAQMLLWTLVIVVLFIAKSAINQALWDIPWPLVALMGVSQAGYLGGKFSQ